MRNRKYKIQYYIGVPDLFSIMNASLGFLSIIMILKEAFGVACQLMLLAIIFDSIDGWIVRRTKRKDDNDFGKNVDSLSDIISFGVAPALLIYSITSFRYINILVSLLIVTCGILRLSRFNVIANVKDTFVGLPIPVMAALVSSIYLSGIPNEYIILLIVTVISFIMVSSIEYPKINAKNGAIIAIPLILTILRFKVFAMILLFMLIIYILAPFLLKIRRDIK